MSSTGNEQSGKAAVKRIGWPLILGLGALAGVGAVAIMQTGGSGVSTTAFAVNESTKTEATKPSDPPNPKQAGLAASYLVGRHAEVTADVDTAVNFYNRAMELDPQNYNLQQATYFLAAQSGDFAAAIPAAQKAYDVSPRKGMAGVLLAVDHYKKGEYDKTWRYLEKNQGQNMNSFALPLMRAWAQAPTASAEVALGELTMLKNFQDTSELVDVMGGLLNEFYGKKDEALAHYDALAANIENQRFSILRLVAEAYHRLGKNEQVKPLVDRFVKTHAASPGIDSYVATVLETSPRKVTPTDGMAEAMFAAAELLLMNEPNEIRAQIATVYAQAALYLNPDMNIARRFIGSTLAARGHYDESNAALAVVKKNAPGYLDVQMQIAENYLRMNKSDDALNVLRDVLKEKANWADAYVAIGDIQRQDKKYSEAVSAYDSALKHAPAKNENWVIYYSRGIALERSKKWDEAEKDFKKALELRPDEPSVLNYLGYSYLDRGVKLAEARKLIEGAYRQRPNDGYIIDSFGWALFKNGEYDKAVQNLERAVESTPSDGTINEHLGDVYWKVGRKNEARFQWQRALGLELEEPQRAGILKKLERGLAQQ
jgi:tetratricopeptide (TPR) repeat protein